MTNNQPERSVEESFLDRERSKLLFKDLDVRMAKEQWNIFHRDVENLLQTERQKMEEKYAHPTKDGYCCACDYDIACIEKTLTAERQRCEEMVEKAWEYCVKAMREESGSREEMKKFITQPTPLTNDNEEIV